jgi:hypothetical protein
MIRGHCWSIRDAYRLVMPGDDVPIASIVGAGPILKHLEPDLYPRHFGVGLEARAQRTWGRQGTEVAGAIAVSLNGQTASLPACWLKGLSK